MSDNSIAGTISAEQRVFFMHPVKGWSVGAVEGLFADVNATVGIAAVTANNASTLKLAIIRDDATGASERVFVNQAATAGIRKSGPNHAAGGVDSVIHPYMEGAYNAADHELFRVNDLHISTLLYCLKDRYEKQQLQYSWLGDTIVSVNPFKMMPYNGPEAQQQYLTALRSGAGGGGGGMNAIINTNPLNPTTGLPAAGPLPPHVWHIAEKAFAGAVVRNDGNQSVVVSGESGSGKTENTKAIIDFLGQLSALHSCNAVQKQLADTVSALIKACNPILESFGNAKTIRNDNSSRFGKYTKLFFNRDSGVIIGGGLVTYLLEKSRIVIQGTKERNYHVFYELLDACNTGGTTLPSSIISQLQLQGKRPQDFAILVGGTATNRINKDEPATRKGSSGLPVSDAKEFQVLLNAVQQMEVPQGTQESIWKCVAAILHLGEVRFLTSESNGKSMLDESTRPSLNIAAKLLGLNDSGTAALLLVFLEKSRTKILTTMATQAEAEALRDAFSKALYVAIFDFLVAHINTKLKVKDLGGGGAAAQQQQQDIDVNTNRSISYVGVLDIFGFENFQTNSFEQLCINFANETLQGHYNRFTFLNDEEECKREGVPSPQVAFPDNSPCLRLFDTPKTGIFAALDEESGFRGGTSDRFTQLLWDQWAPQGVGAAEQGDPAIVAARAKFERPKGSIPSSFSVAHFAATVEYKTAGWLEKNSDTLKEEAAEATAISSDAFVAALLPRTAAAAGADTGRGPPPKKPSVAKHFQKQLSELMTELTNTSTNFIRCIKPNMPATPQLIDNAHVGTQLESAGVVQTVALKRQGYPIRRPIEQFVKSFRCLCPNAVVGRGGLGIRKGQPPAPTPSGASNMTPADQAKAILTYISTAYDWSQQGIEKRKVRLAAHLKETGGGAKIGGRAVQMDPKAIADEVAKACPPFPYCVVGHSKVFLKPIAWSKLELLRKRYNMGRLRKCAPTLRRWVARYRVRKAEAEKKRLAELARLQQEAENRRKQAAAATAEGGGGVTAGGGGAAAAAPSSSSVSASLVATGKQAGLSPQKAEWFADVALQFVFFDISILLDVVYNLDTKESAVAALKDMQKQRLDVTMPAAMRRMLKELNVRDAIVEQLAASNIATMAQLASLQRADLSRLGFNEAEIAAVAQRMLSQQSHLVVNQRLQHEFGGGGDMGDLASHAFSNNNNNNYGANRPVSSSAAGVQPPPPAQAQRLPPQPQQNQLQHIAFSPAQQPPHFSSAADYSVKINRMLEMGIGDKASCATALDKVGGNIEHAVNYLLTGELPAGRPPASLQQQRAPPPAAAPQQQYAPTNANAYSFAPTPMPPRPGQMAPQQQQQIRSAQQPPAGGGGDVSSQVDQAKLAQLVGMGFGRSHAAMALLQTGGNMDKAMDILMR